MKVINWLINRLSLKLVPKSMKVSFEGVSYNFPLVIKFRSATIMKGSLAIKFTGVTVKINNPLSVFFSDGSFKISLIKWQIAEISSPVIEKKLTISSNESSSKINFVRAVSSFVTRIGGRVKNISFYELKFKAYTISDFELYGKKLKFGIRYRDEKFNYWGTIDRNKNIITTKGTASISGTIVSSDHIQFDASLYHDYKNIIFDYQVNSQYLKVISRNLTLGVSPSFKFYLTDRIKLDDLSLDNEMDMVIGTVPLKITNYIKYAESKVLNSMTAVRLDEETFSCFLPYLNTGIKKIKYTGGITFIANMGLSLNNLMNHKFSVFSQDFDFTPVDLTSLHFDRLLHSFEHISFKDSLAVRKIDVEKDYFRDCVNSDSHILLRNIITFCEDPGFTAHIGVDPYFIGKSIVTNLKEKKLSRGGSTITMQLIKNLYLNEKKTFLRKFEEILLSLIFEKYSNLTKSQMLDIYLQIIEFGPNIYGIKEGASYYFDKVISELSIIDSIVLTYILPRPVFFNDALLIRSKQLDENLGKYCRNVSKFLLDNGVLNEQQFKSLGNKVLFSKRLGGVEICLD